MKVKGLDNQEYTISLKDSKRNVASKPHIRARNLLKIVFSFDKILEDISLPGSSTKSHKTLFCDFFIPSKRIIVEVHGEQHYTYNSFHFENKLEFYKAQARDRDKKLWCEINAITLIELPHDKSDNEWLNIINNRGEIETDGGDT